MDDPLEIDLDLLRAGRKREQGTGTLLFRKKGQSEIRGTVATVIHRRNGFVVARLLEALRHDDSPHPVDAVACGIERDDVPVSGSVAFVFLGKWEDHQKFGPRFRWDTYSKNIPDSYDAVRAYCRHSLSGIGFGIRSLDKVWSVYGHESLHQLAESPLEVALKCGIPESVAQDCSARLKEEQQALATRLALHGLFAGRGFPGTVMDWCLGRWGAAAPDMIRANPFILLEADAPGAGFKRVDAMYRELGLELDSPIRSAYCAWSVVAADRGGNSWVRRTEVLAGSVAALGCSVSHGSTAIKAALERKLLISHTDEITRDWLADSLDARCEKQIVDHLARLRAAPPTLWPNPEALIGLTPHQREQLAIAFSSSPVAMIVGQPGTGKTCCAMAVAVALYRSSLKVATCGPTGRSSVRCTELLRDAGIDDRAMTLHKLLGLMWTPQGMRFRHNEHDQLPYDCVIVDEMSMADAVLFSCFLRALRRGTHVLLVGDPDQLPPVGRGAPLRDMLRASWPAARLVELWRTSGRTAEVCRQIRCREKVFLPTDYRPPLENVRHFPVSHPIDMLEALRALLRRFAERYLAGQEKPGGGPAWHPIDDVQIIVPRNSGGDVSRESINLIAQHELNPHGRQLPGSIYRIGDKINCQRNLWLRQVAYSGFGSEDSSDNWEVTHRRDDGGERDDLVYLANGDMGKIVALSPTSLVAHFVAPDRWVQIPLLLSSEESDDDDGGVTMGTGVASDFSPGYAITAHRSQGAQYPVVIIMLDPDRRATNVTSRQWLYTAIARGQELVIVIGDRAVFDSWLLSDHLENRKTFLAESIMALFAEKDGGFDE